MRVIMLGTSAAMPNPDRHDSAILITVRGRHYLFDCGHGATNQMVAPMRTRPPSATCF